MTDFDDYLADRERVRKCGTQTAWYEPQLTTHLIPAREPLNTELVRYLWPELETVK